MFGKFYIIEKSFLVKTYVKALLSGDCSPCSHSQTYSVWVSRCLHCLHRNPAVSELHNLWQGQVILYSITCIIKRMIAGIKASLGLVSWFALVLLTGIYHDCIKLRLMGGLEQLQGPYPPGRHLLECTICLLCLVWFLSMEFQSCLCNADFRYDCAL